MGVLTEHLSTNARDALRVCNRLTPARLIDARRQTLSVAGALLRLLTLAAYIH